jgi:hypothetical protein
MDWDLWLGPAPLRPYHPAYQPWSWRGWWDFGTGVLGDLLPLSTVCKALKLAIRSPLRPAAPSSTRKPILGVIAHEFPARGNLPPVV